MFLLSAAWFTTRLVGAQLLAVAVACGVTALAMILVYLPLALRIRVWNAAPGLAADNQFSVAIFY